MRLLRKSWLLIIAGIVLFVFSDLFNFVYHQTSRFALIFGYGFSIVGFIGLMVSNYQLKIKVLWIIFVIMEISVLIYITPELLKYSHVVYIEVNSEELNNLNEILSDKKGEISIEPKSNEIVAQSLNQQELNNIIELMYNINCYAIWKSNRENTIYYILVEYKRPLIGIAYSCDGKTPDFMNRHLKDNWFY